MTPDRTNSRILVSSQYFGGRLVVTLSFRVNKAKISSGPDLGSTHSESSVIYKARQEVNLLDSDFRLKIAHIREGSA